MFGFEVVKLDLQSLGIVLEVVGSRLGMGQLAGELSNLSLEFRLRLLLI